MMAVRIPAHLLHEACTGGNLPAVQKILKQEALMINMKIRGSTPLARAVIFKHPSIVDLLLAHPTIDPNIHMAEFTQACPSLPKLPEFTQTPLVYAISNRDEEMALKLLAHPLIKIDNCLHIAVVRGTVGIFDALLSHPDADISGTDSRGRTFLHNACDSSCDVVRKILEMAVIDIDARDIHGCTALVNAVDSRHFDLVETLLSAGADVGIPSNHGSNAFHASVLPFELIPPYTFARNNKEWKITRFAIM